MPQLAQTYCAEVDRALDLAGSIETVRITLSPTQRITAISRFQLELVYELAFLRVFLAWEGFLEDSFVRYLCGYAARSGQETMKNGHFFRTIAAAHTAIRQGQPFLLWHNPHKVIDRARYWFVNSRHETVISSIQGRLESFAAVRHRVAHVQAHSAAAFDHATILLVGRRYPGSRPGRFLRDWVPNVTPPTRWLTLIGHELSGLASQVVPSS